MTLLEFTNFINHSSIQLSLILFRSNHGLLNTPKDFLAWPFSLCFVISKFFSFCCWLSAFISPFLGPS